MCWGLPICHTHYPALLCARENVAQLGAEHFSIELDALGARFGSTVRRSFMCSFVFKHLLCRRLCHWVMDQSSRSLTYAFIHSPTHSFHVSCVLQVVFRSSAAVGRATLLRTLIQALTTPVSQVDPLAFLVQSFGWTRVEVAMHLHAQPTLLGQ